MENVYWKALDILRERGMIKGHLENENGVCAIGALRLAMTDPPPHPVIIPPSITTQLGKIAGELFPGRSSVKNSVIGFNDHPDTTQEDLELVFEKTAIKQDELL